MKKTTFKYWEEMGKLAKKSLELETMNLDLLTNINTSFKSTCKLFYVYSGLIEFAFETGKGNIYNKLLGYVNPKVERKEEFDVPFKELYKEIVE